MAIGIILGIVLAAATAGCIAWAAYSFDNSSTAPGVVASVLAVFLALAFLIIPFSFHQVETGEVAVVKYLGKAKEVRTAGTHFDLWFVNQYQYIDGRVQTLDISTAAYSSDAQTMDVQMTVQYQILTDNAVEIVFQYGSLDVLQNRIQAIATEKVKAVLSQPTAMEIIANRASMSPKVEETIRSAIGESYYVNVVAVVLTNIDFSDAFELAVEQKMIAEQNKLKADYENQMKIAQAQANADAKLIAAEAEAKANELLEQSITDKILEKAYLDKWDGVLPNVMSGDNMGMILPDSAIN